MDCQLRLQVVRLLKSGFVEIGSFRKYGSGLLSVVNCFRLSIERSGILGLEFSCGLFRC